MRICCGEEMVTAGRERVCLTCERVEPAPPPARRSHGAMAWMVALAVCAGLAPAAVYFANREPAPLMKVGYSSPVTLTVPLTTIADHLVGMLFQATAEPGSTVDPFMPITTMSPDGPTYGEWQDRGGRGPAPAELVIAMRDNRTSAEQAARPLKHCALQVNHVCAIDVPLGTRLRITAERIEPSQPLPAVEAVWPGAVHGINWVVR